MSNDSFDLSCRGPLYDGRDRSKSSVRINVNLRREAVVTERRLVSAEYDDVMPFLVTVLTAEHILAEKTRALLVRGKARDLYDLWFMVEQEVPVDLGIIDAKLALHQTAFDPTIFRMKVDALEKAWASDLRPLLGQMPEFPVAQSECSSRLTLYTEKQHIIGCESQ